MTNVSTIARLLLCLLWIAPAGLIAAGPMKEVDLRPRYFELGLYTKDQGRRPSCAVFAILGALEFHYSLRHGRAFPLSEEYLLWATRQIDPELQDYDGLSFDNVITALRRHGVARSDTMPNNLGLPLSQLVASEQARADALTRRDMVVERASGSREERIAAMVRELDAGYPVAIALAWPHEGVIARVHTLRDQPVRPGSGHAVTVVGYQRPAGNSDEILFLFKNSYGLRWGIAGHGYISDVFLREHLWEVITFRLPEGT